MAKDGGDFIALWALHVLEVGTGWSSDQVRLFVLPFFLFQGVIEEILPEGYVVVGRLSHPQRCIHILLVLLHRAKNNNTFNLKSHKREDKISILCN